MRLSSACSVRKSLITPLPARRINVSCLRSSERTSRYGQVHVTSITFKIFDTLCSLSLNCGMFAYRNNVAWILMLLLLAVLDVAETADPLTDLGMSRGISHLNFFLQVSQLNISVSFEQKISLGSWFSIRWMEMPPM